MKLETCRVDTDFRSSHVVPCVVLIAKSPWDGVSSTALAFPCCHHGVRSRHSRHEGAARAAGGLYRPPTFFSPPAYSFCFLPGHNPPPVSRALPPRGWPLGPLFFGFRLSPRPPP